MKRGDMLYCAGIDAPRFKVLKARGQIPFAASEEDGSLRGGNYTLDNSYQLRLTLDLIGGEANDDTQLQGLGPAYASAAVFNSLGYFPRHPLEQIEPVDWYAGLCVFEDENADGSTYRYSAWFAGELQHLATWIDAKARREPAPDGTDRGKTRPVRVFLANATRAAEFVRDRAEERGLPEAAFTHLIDQATEGEA